MTKSWTPDNKRSERTDDQSNRSAHPDNERQHRAAESDEPRKILAARLDEANVRVERGIQLAQGSKKPIEDNHEDPANHHHPEILRCNYGVHAGDGLLILDIDDPTELPAAVERSPSTFRVETPHGGSHLYFAVADDAEFSNSNFTWGSIRYKGWFAVGPGSVVAHDACGDCGRVGTDHYEIDENEPIEELSDEACEALQDPRDSGRTRDPAERANRRDESDRRDRVEYPDKPRPDEEVRWLCEDFLPRIGTAAHDDIMDVLRGGGGLHEFRRANDPGSIDQSEADAYALDKLYGAFRNRGDDEHEARKNTLTVFKRFCLESKYDKTGNLRKWLRKGEGYLRQVMNCVVDDFDREAWCRWMHWEHEDGFDSNQQRPWEDWNKNGTPSLVTKRTVIAALWLSTFPVSLDVDEVAEMFELDLRDPADADDAAESVPPPTVTKCLPPRASGEATGEGGSNIDSTRRLSNSKESEESANSSRHRRYPTAKELANYAHVLNPERRASYFEQTLKRLARGEISSPSCDVVMAYCPTRPNGERYVYYIDQLGLEVCDDPADAEWVKVSGSKLKPGERTELDGD